MSFVRSGYASDRLVHPRPRLPSGADQERTTASTSLPLTTVTSSASANTDGSWTTLISSVAVEGSGFWLANGTIGASGVDTAGLVDFAFGPSGSAEVFIEDFQMGGRFQHNSNGGSIGIYIPMRIPYGSEIIARVRCATGSRGFPLMIDVYGDNNNRSFTKCTTYGAVPASSTGTQLTAPGASNTKGAWTELSASTSEPIYAMSVGPLSNWFPGYSNAEYMVDIGYGAASSEVTVVENYYYQSYSSETIGGEWPPDRYIPYLEEPIPAGSRLVARYQQSGGVSGANLIVYGYS